MFTCKGPSSNALRLRAGWPLAAGPVTKMWRAAVECSLRNRRRTSQVEVSQLSLSHVLYIGTSAVVRRNRIRKVQLS